MLTRIMIAAASVGLALGLVGCASPTSPASPVPASTAAAAVQEPSRPDFNATDVAWLQVMIPMTERAGVVLDLVPTHGAGPALTATATAVRESHRSELATLTALRDRAGIPDTDVHAGHVMPGMITAADLDRLRTTSGTAFAADARTLLIAHLDRSTALCHGEAVSGENPAVKQLAAAIERTRAAQRITLDTTPPV